MTHTEVISSIFLLCFFKVVVGDGVGNSYGPPPKEETEVEIQKVEVCYFLNQSLHIYEI